MAVKRQHLRDQMGDFSNERFPAYRYSMER